MLRRLLPLIACVSALAGCYASHDGSLAPGVDGGPPPGFDSSFPPPPVDSSFPPPPPFDSSFPPPPPLDGSFPPPPDGAPPPPFDAGPPPPPVDSGPPGDGGPPPPPVDAGPPPDAGPRDSGIDSGPPRPALRFNRSTFFQVADAPIFDTSGELTFEVWIRSRATGDADFCRKGDAMARHMYVGQRAGVFVAGWQVGGTEHFAVGTPVVRDAWTHLALVARPDPAGVGHAVRLYVNGAPVDARNLERLVDSFNDLPFLCGRTDVDVDEIRLWRVARSAAAIAANYDRRISGGNPGLVAYWRLDEGGQFAFDYTAMGSIGVLGTLTTRDPADPVWIRDGAI